MQQDGQGLCVAADAEVIVWGSNVWGQIDERAQAKLARTQNKVSK